jgi:hypothetical protein
MMSPVQQAEYEKMLAGLKGQHGIGSDFDIMAAPGNFDKYQQFKGALGEARAGLDYGWGVDANRYPGAGAGGGAGGAGGAGGGGGGAGGSLGGNLAAMSEYSKGLMDPGSDYYKQLSGAMQQQIGGQAAAQQRSAALRAAQSGLGGGRGAEAMQTTADIGQAGLEAQGRAESGLALQAPQMGMQGLQSTFSPYMGIERLGEQSRQFGANLGSQQQQFGVGAGLQQQQMAHQMALQQAQMQMQAQAQNAQYQMQQQQAQQDTLMQQYAMMYGMF